MPLLPCLANANGMVVWKPRPSRRAVNVDLHFFDCHLHPCMLFVIFFNFLQCPNNLYALYIGMALVLIVAAGFAYWLNKRQISIALIAIGVDYAQVLSMFSKTRIRWPKFLKDIFQILSAFNLNLDLTAPECMMPDMKWWMKFAFVEALPALFILLFVIIHFIKLAYKALCLNKKRQGNYTHIPTMISTSIVIFRMLYLYLTRTSMDVMNCAPTEVCCHEYPAR